LGTAGEAPFIHNDLLARAFCLKGSFRAKTEGNVDVLENLPRANVHQALAYLAKVALRRKIINLKGFRPWYANLTRRLFPLMLTRTNRFKTSTGGWIRHPHSRAHFGAHVSDKKERGKKRQP
jgi:hypothetical protein